MFNSYINDKGEELYKQKGCIDGRHPLIPIYSCPKADRIEIIRWCPICGSFLIDVEYMNGIHSNDIAKIRRPDISIRTRD